MFTEAQIAARVTELAKEIAGLDIFALKSVSR